MTGHRIRLGRAFGLGKGPRGITVKRGMAHLDVCARLKKAASKKVRVTPKRTP